MAQVATSFVYPPHCPACRAELAASGGLCAECWREVSFIAGPACRSCGAPMAADLGEDSVCDACIHAPPAWDRGAAAVVYEGAGRKLVLSLKHGDRLDVSPLVSGWMAARGGPLVDAADLIAPVPLHWRRLIQRRYNQAGELARDLAAQSDAAGALALDLLVRTRRTAVMDGKTRAERITNVASAFEVDRRWKGRLSGKTVLLVDDVMTTGATLSACAEILRQGGAAHVNVLVFARVARGDWPT